MHVFKHPKYYEEFRQRSKRFQKKFGKRGDRGKPTAASPDTDPVISRTNRVLVNRVQRALGPGALNSDQVISNAEATAASERAPGQGQSAKLQAPSVKPQAPEASSDKRQAPSSKHQA